MKILFLLLLIPTSLAWGQKVSLSKEKATYNSLRLPSNHYFSKFKTYNVQLLSEQKTLNILGFKKKRIEKIVNLYGYTYQEENADFTYIIQMQEPQVLINEKKILQKRSKNYRRKNHSKSVLRY